MSVDQDERSSYQWQELLSSWWVFDFNNISFEETNSGRMEVRKVSHVLPRTLAAAVAIFPRARGFFFFFSVQANFNVRLHEVWLQARIFIRDSQELIFTLQRRQFFRAAPSNLTLKRPPGVKFDPSLLFFSITFFFMYLTMTQTFVTLSRQVSSRST